MGDLNYPKGKLAIEGGELQDVTNVDVSFEDGAKTVHTKRNNGKASGVVSGTKSCTVSFTMAISEEGFERDFLGKWDKEESIEARFKFPGGLTIVVNGKYTKPSAKGPIDSFVEFNISIIGSYEIVKR